MHIDKHTNAQSITHIQEQLRVVALENATLQAELATAGRGIHTFCKLSGVRI